MEVITAEAKDGAFTWTPGDNVKEGQTYAFQVSQGAQRNYSALLRAGPQVPSASDSTTGTTSSATDATSSGTSTGTTTDATQTTATSSKPLISSSASGTPSSSPASTSVVSSTVTAEGPMLTESVTHGKKAKAGVQNAASPLKYSMELVGGALGLLVYLVQ